MWLFGKVKTYTAEDVHNELFLLSIMLIKKIEEEREKQALQVPQKLEEEYNALCKMGLGKSQNALLIKKKLDAIYSLNLTISDHNSQVEYFRRVARFVREVRAYFKNAIVVSIQDFLTLLEKYNLICGDLSDYTGAIPEENIQELKEASELLKDSYHLNLRINDADAVRFLSQNYYTRIATSVSLEQLKEYGGELFKRFPIVYESLYHYSAVNQASFRGGYKDTTGFLIAASPDLITHKLEIKKKEKVRVEDPFVFKYTPLGIVIFTKWGKEADDEVLKKYEELIDGLHN